MYDWRCSPVGGRGQKLPWSTCMLLGQMLIASQVVCSQPSGDRGGNKLSSAFPASCNACVTRSRSAVSQITMAATTKLRPTAFRVLVVGGNTGVEPGAKRFCPWYKNPPGIEGWAGLCFQWFGHEPPAGTKTIVYGPGGRNASSAAAAVRSDGAEDCCPTGA